MKYVMSMTELLHRIKLTRRDIDRIYNQYLNPDSNEASKSRLFVSLYNPARETTVNGVPIDDVGREIQSSFDTINSTMKNLQKYLMVKEQVNATCKIRIPSLFKEGEYINPTVAQILVLKSDEIKDYYTNLYRRLRSDYNTALVALEDRNTKTLNHESIERYVIAKMNSLNLSNDKIMSEAKYDAFSKEYIEANELRIYDPIHIKDLDSMENRINEFYATIDSKLAEFNALTKVWIDLDDDTNFWGFVEINSADYDNKNL